MRPNKPPEERWKTGVEKFDAFVEKNFGAAASPPEGVGQRVKNTLTRGVQLFTRAFAGLPENVAEYAPVKEFLLDRPTQSARSKLTAEEGVYADVHGLSPAEHYQLSAAFTAKNMAENLEWQERVWADAGNDPADFQPVLRGEMTADEVRAAAAAADQLLLDNPKVKAAVDRVFDSRKDILDPWFAAHKAVKGTEPFDPTEKQWYMRQMIVAYENGERLQSGAGGASALGRTPGKPSIALHRQLTTMDYDTHFIESEIDWRAQAIRHTWNLQFVDHLAKNLDITPQVKLAQAFLNSPAVEGHIQHVARGGPSTPAFMDAMGKLAREDHLPDRLDGRFAEVISEFHRLHAENEERTANGLAPLPLSPEMAAESQQYTAWLNGLRNKSGKILPKKVPDTHAEWDLTKMPAYYWGNSVNARLVEAGLNQGLTDLNVPMDRIRKVLMVGRRRTLLLPREVVKTMEAEGMLRPDAADAFYKQLAGGVQSFWKLDKLYGPAHFVSFLTKKLVVDNLNILRYAPKAMLDPKAIVDPTRANSAILGAFREVTAQYGGSVPSPALRKFDAMGGETGLMQGQERVGGTGYRPLRGYGTGRVARPPIPAGAVGRLIAATRVVAEPVAAAGSFASHAARLPVALLEKTARFGVYNYYRGELDRSPTGYPRSYGASKPEQVNALIDTGKTDEAAFKLAEDVVSAYRTRTQGTRWLRRYVVPFASIKEIILHQNIQSAVNAWNDPDIAISAGRRLIGESRGWSPGAQRGATRAWAVGRWGTGFVGSLYALHAITSNLFPDETKKLRKVLGNRPFLVLGHADPKTGEIPYRDNMSGAEELLDQFFDFGNWGFLKDDVMAGRKSFGQAVWEASAQNWKNEAAASLAPQFRFGLEGMGLKVTQQGVRPDRDPYETMLNEVDPGFAALYRQIEHEPQPRGFWKKWATGSTTADPAEMTYFKVHDDVRNWLARRGHPGETGGVPLAGDAVRDSLYWHKQSLRLGDKDSAQFFLHQMRQSMTREDNLDPKKPIKQLDERLQRSYEALDPLRQLRKSQLLPFLKEAAQPKNRDMQLRVRAAYRYYATLAAPQTAAKLPKLEQLPFSQYVLQVRKEIRQEIKQEKPLTGPMTGAERNDFQREKLKAKAAAGR